MNLQDLMVEYFSASPEETKLTGKKIAAHLKKGSVVALVGGLGSGKTTLIKGLTNTLIGLDEREITSPTFNYLNVYQKSIEIYHFDLYRIKNDHQFIEMGFEEYLHPEDGITLIEWSEKITPILPANTFFLHLVPTSETERKITLLKQ